MNDEAAFHAAMYADDVTRLVAGGRYQNTNAAVRFVEDQLGPIWRPVLGIDNTVRLVDHLALTGTMVGMFHFFGRGVLGYGSRRSQWPRLLHWRAVVDPETGANQFPRAVTKRDIARIIDRSPSAVTIAIAQLRGKRLAHARYGVLFEKLLAHPLYVETGIMLDLATSFNHELGFHIDEYWSAQYAAQNARIRDMETNRRQAVWCSRAIASKSSEPHAAEHAPATAVEEIV